MNREELRKRMYQVVTVVPKDDDHRYTAQDCSIVATEYAISVLMELPRYASTDKPDVKDQWVTGGDIDASIKSLREGGM